MARYIPMPAYPDRMPIDISFAFGDEKPAGKHGFCHADGDDLRFEDGTLAKFWGVNFNGGANFPEHDYARKVARRLAMAGVNIVRFHQLDAEWNTPNLLSFCKGPRVTSTRQLEYRNDPVFVLAEIVNENEIFVDSHSRKWNYVPPMLYINEFRQVWSVLPCGPDAPPLRHHSRQQEGSCPRLWRWQGSGFPLEDHSGEAPDRQRPGWQSAGRL